METRQESEIIEEIQKIWKAELNERIFLNHDYISEFRTDHTPNREKPYSWVAVATRSYSSRTIFPLTYGGNQVVFFKSIKAAKRNFLKHYYSKELVERVIKAN
jgi:hypothetical protein